MAQPIPHHYFTYAEYLQYEQDSDRKHEWLDGHVSAMAGGTAEHAALTAELGFVLRRAVDPARCRTYSSDLRVRVEATGLSTYPDLSVVCGPLRFDTTDKLALVNPTVLVEVLSPSTEAYDRGQKWAHYQQIPSLRAYLLADPVQARLELYERSDGQEFSYRAAAAGQRLALQALGIELEVHAIYTAASVIRA